MHLHNLSDPKRLQAASAAQTGCAPDDIQITDDDPEFSSRSWVAWCNSERYQCFGTRNTISCKAAAEKPASPPKYSLRSM